MKNEEIKYACGDWSTKVGQECEHSVLLNNGRLVVMLTLEWRAVT
jgi:hypothetical protein